MAFIGCMLGPWYSESTGMACAIALFIGQAFGIAFTAFRLTPMQWRKWKRAYWLRRPTAQWPFLLMLAGLCFAWSVGSEFTWPVAAFGLLSLTGFWINLDWTVRHHLQREEAQRQSELDHWRNRIPAEEWLARQSLIKRRELAEVQATALRHLMDPHFLFNALNGVMHDMLQGNGERGVSNLGAFKRLATRQIRASQDGWWSLEEEWEVLEDYLQLELRRLQRPLEWCVSPLPDRMKKKTIPAFLVQPLVENALWHGLGGTAEQGSGSLHIHAVSSGAEHAEIVVTNSVMETSHVGIAPHEVESPSRRRHATDLIRQRLRLIDGLATSGLHISTKDSLTHARLIVPCREKMWRTS